MSSPEPAEPAEPAEPSRYRGPLILGLKIALGLIAIWYFSRLVRRVDWAHVWASLQLLAIWQIGVLLLVVALRQTLNATPLSLYVPGLGVPRAVMNDLSANLTATVAPPPADLVLRMAMFRSWGIDTSSGASGLTLNTLAYYVARFGAPTVGFLVALAFDGFHPGYAWTALTGGAIAASIVVGLVLVSRGRKVAAGLGLWLGNRARRFSKKVDPQQWSDAIARFQVESSSRLRTQSWRAGVALLALLLTEGLLLVLCLRFTGVPGSVAPAWAVLAALLVSYPLTALPFAGLGVLDAAIVTILSNENVADPSAIVAALVIWRVGLLLVPLLLGLGSVFIWRRQQPDEADALVAPDDAG